MVELNELESDTLSVQLVHYDVQGNYQLGSASISYAMELFPHRVSKAVYVAAAMLPSGQSTLDMFSQKADSNDLMRQAQIFLYANGNTQPPTAINLDKSLLRDLLFNQSPAKDVALASVSMRPIPFAPVLEKLSLSEKKYGSNTCEAPPIIAASSLKPSSEISDQHTNSLHRQSSSSLALTHLRQKHRKGEPITMITAYDYLFAIHLYTAGIDICLVGDSASMVVHGHDTTLLISLDEMLVHCEAPSRITAAKAIAIAPPSLL
ncbi:unnamed protein product [Camellia sinensis]